LFSRHNSHAKTEGKIVKTHSHPNKNIEIYSFFQTIIHLLKHVFQRFFLQSIKVGNHRFQYATQNNTNIYGQTALEENEDYNMK
jgi:hypothetical protein